MPRYTDEQKQTALLLMSGKRPIKAIAKELGMTTKTLYAWRTQAAKKPTKTPQPLPSKADTDAVHNALTQRTRELSDTVAELKRLRNQLVGMDDKCEAMYAQHEEDQAEIADLKHMLNVANESIETWRNSFMQKNSAYVHYREAMTTVIIDLTRYRMGEED